MERDIGGIRCSAVLARLADIVDGELSEYDRDRITAHVMGCPECAKFGARYQDVIRALRDADVSPEIAAALDERLGSLAR